MRKSAISQTSSKDRVLYLLCQATKGGVNCVCVCVCVCEGGGGGGGLVVVLVFLLFLHCHPPLFI